MKNLSVGGLTDDQYFLLSFIMGTYFGPDLKAERPRKSALQRRSESMQPYATDTLAGSHLKIVVLESVYYYILRKAESSIVVGLPSVRQFLRGDLPTQAQGRIVPYLKFDDLFPPKLHPHSRLENRCDSIANIVFINDPMTYYIKLDDIERFKRLTGLEEFYLDRDNATSHVHMDNEILCNDILQEESKPNYLLEHTNIFQPLSCVFHNGTSDYNIQSHDTKCSSNPLSNIAPPYSLAIELPQSTDPVDDVEQRMMILFPSRLPMDEWNNMVAAAKSGFALTGSAATGRIGPTLGLIDIGESEDSYIFRASLPGVRRDERDFSCEVERDGSILIKGVTVTGDNTVQKYSQLFEMQSQNLSPSGNFSISFKLPGPVDPQQFHGTFGTDGILEGIAMKAESRVA